MKRFLMTGIFPILTILVSLQISAHADSLSGFTNNGTASTSSTTFATVTSVNVTAAINTKILVVATFTEASTGTLNIQKNPQFNLTDIAGTPQNTIYRTLQAVSGGDADKGIGSIVNLYTATAANPTYYFQHRVSTAGNSIQTKATIVAIPLTASPSNDILASASARSSVAWSGSTPPSQYPAPLSPAPAAAVPGTTITVNTVPGYTKGGYYVAASVETYTLTSGGSADTGIWQLQYSSDSGGTWINFGLPVQRNILAPNRFGIANLMAFLPNQNVTGYQFRLVHQQLTGSNTIYTNDVNIAAVFTGINGGLFFPAYSVQSPAVTTVSNTPVEAIGFDFIPLSPPTSVFMHAQYWMSSTGKDDAHYDLFINPNLNPPPTFTPEPFDRYLPAGSTGSGASVGLATGLTAASAYRISLRHSHDATGQTLTTSNPTLFMLDLKTATPVANLSVTKICQALIPGQNDVLIYTITVSNSGPDASTIVSLTDAIPAGIPAGSNLTDIKYAIDNTIPPAAGIAWPVTNTISLGSIASGGSRTVRIYADVPQTMTGIGANTATATSSVSAPASSAPCSNTVTPQADLAVTKICENLTAGQTNKLIYTIAVTNNGPSAAAAVRLTDAIPAGVPAGNNLANIQYRLDGGALTPWTSPFDLGSMLSGSSHTIQIYADVPGGMTGIGANTASVSEVSAPPVSDPIPANNSATCTNSITVAADLSVTKTCSALTGGATGVPAYTITVTNNGPSNAPSVTLTDTLPAGLSNATWTLDAVGQGSWSGSAPLGAMTAAASHTIVISVNVDPLLSTLADNTASVSDSLVSDPVPGNNSATCSTSFTPAPVGVTGVVSIAATTPSGQSVWVSVADADLSTLGPFTVTVKNNATNEFETVTLTETGPNTGIFLGNLLTSNTAGAGVNDNGIMNTQAGQTLTVTYVDALDANGLVNQIRTATGTITAANVIDAVADYGSVNGVTGGANVVANVLANDSLNGTSPVNLADVNLSQVSTTDPGVTLNPLDGSVNVAPNTPAGIYIVTYQICEIAVPANCDTANVTVTVTGPEINANDDAFTVNTLTGGITASVFDNDTLNGIPFLPGNVTATIPLGGDGGIGVTINMDGTLNVPAGVPAANYMVTYQICDNLNLTVCDTATVSITVLAAPADAIAGTVFNDSNGDGLRDPGESGISGVTVLLYDNTGTTLLWSTVTASDGTYIFANLAPAGIYDVVEVDLYGYLSTTSNTVENAAVSTINDFGDQQQEKVVRRAIKFENTFCTACNSDCVDPTEHYVSVPDSASLDLGATGTIEAWIQATSCTPNDVDAGIVVKGDALANFAYGFGLAGGSVFDTATPSGTAQNIGFRLGSDVLVATDITLIPGKWYHVACVWGAATMRIYINGVLEAGPIATAGALSNLDPLIIGRQNITSVQYYGVVEESRVWNTARTETEIRDNMCKTLSLPAAGLVCYLQYNESDGFSPSDASGNGNNGTAIDAYQVCSEAPVGDSSAYDYYDILNTYSVSITAGTDTLAASPFTGTWNAASKSGIQIYRVEAVPEPANGPMGSKLFGSRGYWGVFVTGGVDPTYQVTYTYGLGGIGNTANLDLLYRHQGCAPWVHLNASPGAGTLTKTGLEGTEFILGKNVDPRNAIDFDGTGDYVGLVPNTNFGQSTNITIELWFKTSSVSRGVLVGQRDATAVGGVPAAWVPTIEIIAGNIRAEYWTGGVGAITTASAYNDDRWYHLAFVGSSTNQTLYINGIAIGSRPGNIVHTWWFNTDIGVGYDDIINRGAPANGWYYFDGIIDEVRVWTTALTQAQIRANMCRKLLGTEAGLAGYWRFDEETASVTCPDYAGANDGTMTNFTTPVLFPIETARICSSAPIGDASGYDYYDGIPGMVSAQVTHSDGDYLRAVQNTGTWTNPSSGIQVYQLDEAPVYPPDLWTTPNPPYSYQSPNGLTPPAGWSSVDYYRYWGVFTTDWGAAAKTYDATYYYNGNPMVPVNDSILGLARRPDYCFGTWSDSTATLNTVADTLIKTLETGTEYVLGGKDAPLAITLASFTAKTSEGCVDVEWETATEIDTAGFYVWRSDNPLVGFVRLDNSFVASKAITETMGEKYTFSDCGVDFSSDKKYYYMLQEIEINGDEGGNMHGPIGPVSENVTAAQTSGGGNDKNCFIDSLSW